jgi:hypothetical protein
VRLLDAGYRTIWLGVQDHRLAAIAPIRTPGLFRYSMRPIRTLSRVVGGASLAPSRQRRPWAFVGASSRRTNSAPPCYLKIVAVDRPSEDLRSPTRTLLLDSLATELGVMRLEEARGY